MLLVSSSSGDDTEDRSIDLLTLRTGERRVLVQGGVLPRYLPTGHLVFLRGGALMAVPLRCRTAGVRGRPGRGLGRCPTDPLLGCLQLFP